MKRSAVALTFTLAPIKRTYLWTFTLPKRVPVDVARSMWEELRRALVRTLGMQGVRVFELHPNGHGLHVHVVTSRYWYVGTVRKLTGRHGWGRIHVAYKVKMGEDAARYLSKYMTKGARCLALRGVRLWARMGGFAGTLVKDLICDSVMGRICRAVPLSEVGCIGERAATLQAQWWARMQIARRYYVRWLMARDVPAWVEAVAGPEVGAVLQGLVGSQIQCVGVA